MAGLSVSFLSEAERDALHEQTLTVLDADTRPAPYRWRSDEGDLRGNRELDAIAVPRYAARR